MAKRRLCGNSRVSVARCTGGTCSAGPPATSPVRRATTIVLLLDDLYWAGGWRPYAAARRMPYVRIRHEVSKTYKVLKEDHDDRALLHFVFRKSQRGSSSEYMRMLPRWLFRNVIGYLES